MSILALLTESPLLAVLFLAAIIIAVTVHEFAHAWTAYKLGDDTPYLMGRVTLNPLAHLDPIGSLAFLLAGFGWGKPVIYNPMRLQRKSDELLIALAGPFSNLLLAIALNILATYLPQISPIFNAAPFQAAALVNIYLAAFNMLPIPPLDGSSIVAFFWPNYRSLAGGQVGLIILLALIFIPVGSSSLLSQVVTPIIHIFANLTTLFGLLSS
jgi:Zn-dependent protease